jgi:hypothetical protein
LSGVTLFHVTIRASFAVIILAASMLGQQARPTSAANFTEPTLPVIDYDACPFEGCTFGKWKVTKDSKLYSSWQDGRAELGTLNTSTEVAGLTGVHITRKPDKIVVTKAIPDLDAQPGDVILRYMHVGEGFANIWIKGSWHKEYDCSFVTEKENEGCLRDCSGSVAEYGVKEWWVQIKTHDDKMGWVLVNDNFDGMDSLASLNSAIEISVHFPDYLGYLPLVTSFKPQSPNAAPAHMASFVLDDPGFIACICEAAGGRN